MVTGLSEETVKAEMAIRFRSKKTGKFVRIEKAWRR